MFYFVCLCEGMFVCLSSGFSQPMWARHVVVCGPLRGGVWHEMCASDGERKRANEYKDSLCCIAVLSFSASPVCV